MNISKVNNNQQTQLGFKSLILESSARKVLPSLTKKEKQAISEVSSRLENTKFWDLHVEADGILSDYANEGYAAFLYTFVNKKNPENILKCPIHISFPKGKRIDVIAKNKVQRFKFATLDDAKSFSDSFQKSKEHFRALYAGDKEWTSLFPEKLSRHEEELMYLEKSSEYMSNKKSLWDNIKNFFGIKF